MQNRKFRPRAATTTPPQEDGLPPVTLTSAKAPTAPVVFPGNIEKAQQLPPAVPIALRGSTGPPLFSRGKGATLPNQQNQTPPADRVTAFITGPLAQAINSFDPTPTELVTACAAILRLKGKSAPNPDAAAAFAILSEEVAGALDRAAQRIAAYKPEASQSGM